MFKESTVIISTPIRKRMEEERKKTSWGHMARKHKALFLALGFAYDIVKWGVLGTYADEWAADDPNSTDYNRAQQLGGKYVQGCHGENNRFSDAVLRASRIEAHVHDFPCPTATVIEVIVSFYDASQKEPFMEIHAEFLNNGTGGIVSSSHKG